MKKKLALITPNCQLTHHEPRQPPLTSAAFSADRGPAINNLSKHGGAVKQQRQRQEITSVLQPRHTTQEGTAPSLRLLRPLSPSAEQGLFGSCVGPWDRSCWTTTPAGCESPEVHPPCTLQGEDLQHRGSGRKTCREPIGREVIDEMTDSRSDFPRLWPLL